MAIFRHTAKSSPRRECRPLADGGGDETALGRHAVAALLNATSKGVAFGFFEDDVIALVQLAYLTGDFEPIKNQFELQNELGCTVDTSGGSGRSGGNRTPAIQIKRSLRD